MYLVDTNVISEARKGKRANRGVQNFFQASDTTELYVAVQTIGEIRRGLENIRHRGDLSQAKRLESWLDFCHGLRGRGHRVLMKPVRRCGDD